MQEEETTAAVGSAATAAPALLWSWVGTGVLLGGALIATFVWVVDPTLSRPALSTLVSGLSLILVGILIAYHSPGETIRETGVAGLALVVLVSGFLIGVLDYQVKFIFVLLACLYGPSFAMAGGWVGEMLQGTLEQPGSKTRKIEWAWIAVGVIIGFMSNVYAVFMADALFGLGIPGFLLCFAGSFVLTGYIVGLHSPGITILEPGIAAVGMVILDTLVAVLGFQAVFPLGALVLAATGGVVLGLIGGWLGEITQVATRARKRAQRGPPA